MQLDQRRNGPNLNTSKTKNKESRSWHQRAASSSSLPDHHNAGGVDSSLYEEKTEVIYGEENVKNWALHRLSTVNKTLDLCGDRYGPLIITANEQIMQKYVDYIFGELDKGRLQRSLRKIS